MPKDKKRKRRRQKSQKRQMPEVEQEQEKIVRNELNKKFREDQIVLTHRRIIEQILENED